MNRIEIADHRDDVWFKVPLARDILLGRTSEFATALYQEHLYRWNNFSEESPLKRGVDEYMEHFLGLAKSMASSRGMSGEFDPIPVSANGVPLDGSHRLSLMIAASELGLGWSKSATKSEQRDSPNFSWEFFARKGVHPSALLAAITQKVVSNLADISLLTVWPSAGPYRREMWETIKLHVDDVGVAIECDLNWNGLQNLVAVAYRDEDWAQKATGISRKAMSESTRRGNTNTVLIVPLPQVSIAERQELKRNLRRRFPAGSQGVHTTDSRSEAIRIWTSVSTKQSLAALNAIEVRRYQSKLRELAVLSDSASSYPFGPDCIAVSGSQWLDFYGVRSSNDIDLVSDSAIVDGPEFSHNQYLKEFGLDATALVNDPRLHVWMMGLKFLAPKVYLQVMMQRGEPKDRAYVRGYANRLVKYDPAGEATRILHNDISTVHRLGKRPSPFASFEKETSSSESHHSRPNSNTLKRHGRQPKRLFGELGWKILAFTYRRKQVLRKHIRRAFDSSLRVVKYLRPKA